ncbi:MAG: polysaccharide biosynthesis protein [Acidobacteria bacterium]|nr:MAG: polysaccharide biosynthesis protein [Acidobacteriota bacterium]
MSFGDWGEGRTIEQIVTPKESERELGPPVGLQMWQRLLNRPVQFVFDVAVLALAFIIAYFLRFEFELAEVELHKMLAQLPLVVLIQFGALNLFGIYSFVWRYIGMTELRPFLKAAWWSFLLIVLMRLGLPADFGQWRVPLSIILMDTMLAFGGVLALRVLRRAMFERFEKERRARGAGGGAAKPVLLVGAGRAGVLAAREIQARGDMGITIRGFVDDDFDKHGSVIQGVKVLGASRELPSLVADLGIDHVVISIAQTARKDLRRIVDICEAIPVRARIIPGLYELIDGSVEISRIRDVEIEDLLGRDPVNLDEKSLAEFLKGKTVMVTGAGGSIGSELCCQVARFGAGRVLMVERAEFALFDADRTIRAGGSGAEIVPLVADICDEPRMRTLFETYRPAVVFHAAAHKHVPLMENNAGEAVKNNILGTRLLAELAGEFAVETFVQISTDKAVRPTSIMGASKRAAELAAQDLNHSYDTQYISVRFGNVLGSAGSVVPIFRKQIEEGGPVTVTHPDMVRYFMTIPEASQLVVQAGAIGEGGEIFILDMGDPVRIVDMAKDMITLCGLKPYEDIDIEFTGMRPGEKLFEELETVGETITKTRHPKIFIGTINTYGQADVERALERFKELSDGGDEADLRRFFNELLPEARVSTII